MSKHAVEPNRQPTAQRCFCRQRIQIRQIHSRFLDLAFIFVLALLASRKKHTVTIKQPLLPLTYLNRVNGVFGSELLYRLPSNDRIHSDWELELESVGAPLAHEWETPIPRVVPRLKG